MKTHFPGLLAFTSLALFGAVNVAFGQTITDLFNMGVDSSGAKLGLGVQDPHYINLADATRPYTFYIGVYASNTTSNWLSPTANGGNGTAYTLKYRTTFTLPVNALLSSVVIAGAWGTDNNGLDILINGHSTGITLGGSDTFHFFHTFTLPSTFYQTGQNTLDFQWINNEGAGAIDAYFTQASYTSTTANASGTLRFQSLVSYADNQKVTFEARPVSGGAVVTQTVAVPPSGVFTISGLAFGPYVLHIKAEKFLAANVTVDTTNGNAAGVTATLRPGDANNDNSVDSTDFGLLIGAYGSDSSVPNSGYAAGADFNGDGSVDSTDFTWLILDYNLTGAQ